MFNSNKIIFICFTGVIKCIFSQTAATLDTISIPAGHASFSLNHKFVIDSTFQLFSQGRWLNEFQLDPINGVVDLTGQPTTETVYISSYQYLTKPPPLKVGPLVQQLPLLDSLIIENTVTQPLPSEIVNRETEYQSEILTSGTVFRNLELTPFGGTDFSGGLQFQLQGKLADDILVSGVLSDQNLPIQPEGNTQSLEEIDKVYIHVAHPKFQITAGDIDYNINSGKYFNINRKLIGLKNNIKSGSWSADAVYAGSKGRYYQMSFKGMDGNQGPYLLSSENGNRDIIVLAGSERVWLDGRRMTRGENNDYIIDYSTGELKFTPRHIIHSDSDILIEYQYSDFRYGRNVVSSSVKKEFGQRGDLTFSWIREFDQTNKSISGLSHAARDSLRNVGDGDAVISGIIEDASGDYIRSDSIYIYTRETSDTTQTRYSITFQNDDRYGSYAKKVSALGRVYYEYVPVNLRLAYQDLYSPKRIITSPVTQDIMHLAGQISLSDQTNISAELALSNFDRNSLSNLDDNDNLGLAHRLEFKQQGVPLVKTAQLAWHVSTWTRGSNFHSSERDREVLFIRDWNLVNPPAGEENMTNGGLAINVPGLGKTSFDWSRYSFDKLHKDRLYGDVNISTQYFQELNASYNQILTQSKVFQQSQGYVALFSGGFHPFFSHQGEFDENQQSFSHNTAGVIWDRSDNKVQLGIGRRIEKRETDSTRTGLEKHSTGILGELDWTARVRSGWSGDLVLRKNVKTFKQSLEKYDYQLARLKLNYYSVSRPIKWDLRTNLEESYTERRVVVYDSVGAGLGEYRYDPEFKEYVADPNGPFIAYTVLTGDRRPTTSFDFVQNLNIDFNKSNFKLLKAFNNRLEIHGSFQGRNLQSHKIINPDISDSTISISRWSIREEIDFNPSRSLRRIRGWIFISEYLNGLDPRGSDLINERENNLEWREPVTTNWQLINIVNQHSSTVNSQFSVLRERSVIGWWLESGVKRIIDRSWQIDIFYRSGKDKGQHREMEFVGWFSGIKLEILRFIGKSGRVQSRLEWSRAKEKNGLKTLPPEALRGLPVGQSFRINIQGHILLGNNLSVNVSLDFLDNARYQDLITINGELRAYF